MTWTYDASLLSETPLYAVRFHIRDTSEDRQLLSDEEITYSLSENNDNVYLAAVECATTIALEFASKADKSVDGLSISYSTQARTYMEMAATLAKKARRRSVPRPWAGGISASEKQTNRDDDSIDHPSFSRGMHDYDEDIPEPTREF